MDTFGFLCISSTFFFMAIWFCFWNKITVYIKRLVEITMNKRNIISIYAYTYTQTLQKNTCISVANINIWIISKDRNSRQTLGHPKCASQKINILFNNKILAHSSNSWSEFLFFNFFIIQRFRRVHAACSSFPIKPYIKSYVICIYNVWACITFNF